MDAMESPVLESRSERIARYKAERRRELAERYGNMDELPSKWVKRDGKEAQDPRVQAHRGTMNSDGLRVNGRTRGVTNGLEAPAECNYLERLVDAQEEENCKVDVKTDDRAKMSVAAKMSLFKELEKSAAPEASAFLKPRSGGVCHERRGRRGNDHRFLTQPITCEEMVAISAPKPALPVESQCEQVESVEEVDESCRLSMSEKLALFNNLSVPGKKGTSHTDGPPERRRQKGARYRTQPITVEEVNLLQKGPVQLPAFPLSSHLSDRQQASSVNLKPSEVRLSQPRPDTESGPGSQGHNSEPGLRGILKKNRTERSSCSGTEGGHADVPHSHEKNGAGCGEEAVIHRRMAATERRRERGEASGVEGGASLAAPPWRQRTRNRRETIACTPVRASSEQDALQEETKPRDQLVSSVDCSSDMKRKVLIDEETTAMGHVQVSSELQETTNRSSRKEDTENLYREGINPQCWTNLSFEAQEVSSPTKNPTQPQWRQKVDKAEEVNAQQERGEEETGYVMERGLRSPELDANVTSPNEKHSVKAQTCSHQEMSVQSVMEFEAPSQAQDVKDETPACESSMTFNGGFYSDQPPPSACAFPPCGDAATTESEQDLGVFCQTNTPILTSAVAEHRRSVRPSRRTQGSRNPLRALAARDDIRQDFMADRAAEERAQAEKKCKNSSAATSENCLLSSDAAQMSHPPFSSLMLIHIKGRWHVQARLVEPSVRSLNSGDCFLLVTPEHCAMWSGEFASEQEKAKGLELASFIQSHSDLGCHASQVVHLEEGLNSDGSAAAEFWNLLGGRTQYRGAGAPEEDELYERGMAESNCVYRLVENRLVPHEQAWASIPTVSLLGSTEALVFDFGSEVYLWHGQDVPCSSRSVALQLTHQVWAGAYDYSNCRVNPLDPTQCNPGIQLRGEGRPSWALFSVLAEDNETALFREKFKDWTDRRTGRTGAASVDNDTQSVPALAQSVSPASDLLSPCDAKALVSGQSLEGDGLVHNVLGGIDVHRGYGVLTLEGGPRMQLGTVAVDTWHVQEFDDSEIPVASTGQLHEGDAYVVRWTYSVSAADEMNGSDECSSGPSQKENTAFFLWRGRHSSASGRDTAAFLSIGMNNLEESQVLVPQGKEPPCFLQLFQGGLVIHRGKREEASTNAAWRLFCVRGELPEEGSLLEVDCCCAGLRSRGSVVLLNCQQGVLYLWTGCKAQASTREVSKRAVERLTQLCPPELGLSKSCPVKVEAIEEGSEPADFWTALGHMDRKAYDCMLQDPGKYNFTPRLFHLSAASGRFQGEELQSPCRLPGLVTAMPFVQESLFSVPQPALFLLDNRLEVYLWQRGQPEQTQSSALAWSRWNSERKCAMQTALQYCKEMNPRRPPQAYLIFEGSEPLTFTNVFPHWERNLGPHTQGDTDRGKLTLVQDALAQLMRTQYPLEELLQNLLPEGVNPQQLDVYLSDQDFQTVLEMKRDEDTPPF
ncbi:supervillin-like isoform X3 [Solea senegalensis]|uniref:Supervillin-like isoform X3 n=1 Tax=Solea senegalensis TaxID=28829 RepID=A0AAV6RGQ8_SOLSE|nr:supervillin-like isoform X3 [Solea senegalensis]